jgi:polygalacturonase
VDVRLGTTHRPSGRLRALVLLAVTAAATAGLVAAPAGTAAGSGPTQGTAAASGRAVRADDSTATVVVARTHAGPVLAAVGTSTVTVRPGATVGRVLAALRAVDGSRQARTVVGDDGTVRRGGAVRPGDWLRVVAEDGLTVGRYDLAVREPGQAGRDGVYWDQDRYDLVDSTVNAHTPVFPARRCDITSPRYAGLVRRATETYYVGNQAGDPAVTTSPLVSESQRVWYYTDAIDAAIADCHAAGGGYVVVPAEGSRNADGAYYSGAINLLSNVNLRVETGATVRFMRNKTNEYYPVVRTSYEGTDLYSFSPLIYAYAQHDIAVSGGGTLDGQEDMWNWRPWKKGYWGEPSVENKSTTASYGENGILNRMNFDDLPVEKRIFTDDGHVPATIPVLRRGRVRQVPPPADATVMSSTFRPSFIQPNDSTNVLIEGIHLRNTPFWVVHPLESRNVLVRDVDIWSDKTKDFESSGWNNDDGLDPESSRDVVLERNHVTVSDDGGAIKAGRNVNGREHRDPSEGIIIRDSVYRNEGGGSAAISMGSEMSGGIRDVFIHDDEFGGPGLSLALKIKTNSTRGGAVENIYLRDCLLRQASSGLVQLDANYSETVPFPGADVFDPKIRNIYLDNVDTAPTMTPGRTTFQLSSSASRSPVENVFYRNSEFYTSSTLAAGFSRNKLIRHLVVEGVEYVDPATGARTRYDTTPLELLDRTAAVAPDADPVRLVAATLERPDTVTAVPSRTFSVTGAVDLSRHPSFPSTGTVRVYLDRNPTAVPVQLAADGSFTTGPITLDDDQPWYRDRHYVSVNFYDGIDLNTEVYQVVARS